MNKDELKQEVETQETEVQENPLEKLSIEELEKSLVDSEQIIKVTKAEMKEDAKIEELAGQIKDHRANPKWNEHKAKIDELKVQMDEIKVDKDALQAEIDEDISEQIAEKSQLEAPYKEIIKGHTANIKLVLKTLEEKGRVVQVAEEPE